MRDNSIVKALFAVVWIGFALAGPVLSRAKKKRESRERADAEALEGELRDAGEKPRPRVVLRPRPEPAAAPPAPPPRPEPENLARYGMAEDSPAFEGRSVAEVLRALEERREARRTAAERAAAETRAAIEAERARAAAAEAARRAKEEAAREAEASRKAAAAQPRDVLAGLLSGRPGETRADALRRAVLLHEILGRRGA